MGDSVGMKRSQALRSAHDAQFHLSGIDGTMVASGVVRSWDAPLAGSLAGDIAATLGAAGSGAGIAVGALPFHPEQPAHLFEPRTLSRREPGQEVQSGPAVLPSRACPGPLLRGVEPGADTAEYEALVVRALRVMEDEASLADGLRKVVLARRVLLHTPEPVDVAALVARLRADPGVTVFAVPLPEGDGDEGMFVGATPELLLEKSGRSVISGPLAGSVRRQPASGADAAAAQGLLRSVKDRFEHRLVVEFIADALAPYCRELTVPAAPSLVATRSMWHLGTRIVGELKDRSVSTLELLAEIHPTPAVCGYPAERAASVIAELEPLDRGFYGGAVGWCDSAGDGRWHLAIRCAEVTRDAVRLFAGAGIVPGSDPVREAAETSAKLSAMLTALGIDGGEGEGCSSESES